MNINHKYNKGVSKRCVSNNNISIVCNYCNDDIANISIQDIELYEKYFGLKCSQRNNIESISKIESMKNILDFDFNCNCCGNTITIITMTDLEERLYCGFTKKMKYTA